MFMLVGEEGMSCFIANGLKGPLEPRRHTGVARSPWLVGARSKILPRVPGSPALKQAFTLPEELGREGVLQVQAFG